MFGVVVFMHQSIDPFKVNYAILQGCKTTGASENLQ